MPTISSQRPPSKKKKKTTKKVMPKTKKVDTTAAPDIISSLTPVTDIIHGAMKLGIYGRSGSGKTRLACKFKKPLMLIRANEGTRSVSNVKGVDASAIITDPDQLGELVRHQRKTEKYATIVLDEITTYQDIILAGLKGWSLDFSSGDNNKPQQLRWGDVSQNEWGEVARELKGRVGELLNLAEHGTDVIVLAQEREFDEGDRDDETRDEIIPNIMFALGPASAGWLAKEVDYACRTFIRNAEVEEEVPIGKTGRTSTQTVTKRQYCVQIGPHPNYYTKFRVPEGADELPDVLVSPTYEDIADLIGD